MSKVFDIDQARFVHAGTLNADPAWMMEAHSHSYWEFIYFLSGRGRIDLPHTSLRPQQFFLAVYPPEVPHFESADPSDPEVTIFLSIHVPGALPEGAPLLLPDHRGELRWLCERIIEEHRAHGNPLLIESYTRAFLLLVERAWEGRLPARHDAVDQAVQYLHANYAQPITLTALANAVSVTEMHLSHRFSARLGISPMRYLRRIRIETAMQLLATTDLPVNAIATQVGFADPFYFSRVLKETTGCSPTAFRRQADPARISMPGAR